jgi:cytochrome b561
MLKDSRLGYGLLTIVLHWLCALFIVGLFGLGIYMVDLDYYDPWYHRAPALHVSIGLILLLLMALRLGWRAINSTPAPLPNYSRRTHWLATGMKYLLYIFILVVIATGYLITSAEGKPASLFGWVDFPIIAQLNPDGVDIAGEVHELLAWAIVLLAGLHAGAALMHHFVIRDKTLVRMLKPVKSSVTAKQDSVTDTDAN